MGAHAAHGGRSGHRPGPAKSSFGSEAVVRAQTLKFEATPAGIKLTSEGTDAQGKPMQGQYTSNFDGKDVAWTGNPSADMACPTRIDDTLYQEACTPRARALTGALFAGQALACARPAPG